jgi:hypothetical protein
MRRSALNFVVSIVLALASTSGWADDAKRPKLRLRSYIEAEPLLQANCVPCHRVGMPSADVRFDGPAMTERNLGRAIVCIQGHCTNDKLTKMPPGRERWRAEERSALLDWMKREQIRLSETP